MRTIKLAVVAAACALFFAACEGPMGPMGPTGTDGVPGSVTLTGTAALGETLTASYTPVDTPRVYFFWYRNDGGTLTHVRDPAEVTTTTSTSTPLTSTYTTGPSDIGKTIIVQVYALGYTGYAEAESVQVSDSSTALTVNAAYTGGTIAAGEAHWYSFAASGSLYNVCWDETGTGSGYTANIYVSAYQAGETWPIGSFTTVDRSYTTPRTIGGYTGTVYLKVTPSSSSSTGTYAVKVESVTFPPGGPTPLTVGSGSGSDTWLKTGSITANGTNWYSFTASGSTYKVQWEDSDQQSGSTYTGDIYVSAFKDDGTAMFYVDRGYTTPETIWGGYNGTVYLRVTPYDSSAAGTYAVRVYTE